MRPDNLIDVCVGDSEIVMEFPHVAVLTFNSDMWNWFHRIELTKEIKAELSSGSSY